MGIGLIMHIVAKIVFVLVGYGIHMYLGKALSPTVYGSIGVVLSIININYNFLSNGARQAASHLIATNKYDNKDILKKSYLYQLLIAFGLSIINFFGADFFAKILNGAELANYIKMTAFMIPFTAMYFMSVGILNGYKFLALEAITVTVYPLVRLSIIPFVAFIFQDSILGTIAGFFVAAIIGCVLGTFFLIRNVKFSNQKKELIRNKAYLKQIIEFLSFFLCITIILNLDMLFVNALVVDGNEVGFYTGATNFSKVSYYLLSAIYLVALPVVTSAYSKKDMNTCRDSINRLLMLIMAFILPIVSIAGPICGNLMEVFYTAGYRQASMPTELLMVSQFFLGLFVVLNILICSAQSKTFSTKLGIIVVIIDAALCYLLIPQISILGASMASLIANIVGVIFAWKKLHSIFGAVWDKRLTKILFANLITFCLMTLFNFYWSSSNFFVVVAVCVVAYGIFGTVLILTKTVPISVIMSIMKKQKQEL